MNDAIAYFITFSTYGSWLHGKNAGSVARRHNGWDTPFLQRNPQQENSRREAMRQPEYVLDEARRNVVLSTILEVARHRKWTLWAVHVRSQHVHVVVTATGSPEKVMTDLKSWASRRLRESFGEDADRDRWTQHGSTRYIWNDTSLAKVVDYVVNRQGELMACYMKPSEPPSSEQEA